MNSRPWGGTTLGHAIFYGPNADLSKWSRIRAHEHVHVEQAEMAMVQSLLIGAVCGIILIAHGHFTAGLVTFFMIWPMGYILMGAAGWLTAWLRGEEPYRGSTHEESARGQDDDLAERRS